jgi:hypothetical protein
MSSSRHAPKLEQIRRWITNGVGVTDGVNSSLNERNGSLAYFRPPRFTVSAKTGGGFVKHRAKQQEMLLEQ